MNRQEAIKAGATTYFTGKPCKHGHIAERYVANFTCVKCFSIRALAYQRRWRTEKPEKQREYAAKYAEKHNKTNKEWRKNNKEKTLLQRRKWDAANREKRNLLSKNWRDENKSIVYALVAKRRSDVMQRTPKWLTPIDFFEMECIYRYRTALNAIGLDYHVDHIIPLRGKLVSGLHTPFNLQVIPANDNVRKSNSFSLSNSWMGS